MMLMGVPLHRCSSCPSQRQQLTTSRATELEAAVVARDQLQTSLDAMATQMLQLQSRLGTATAERDTLRDQLRYLRRSTQKSWKRIGGSWLSWVLIGRPGLCFTAKRARRWRARRPRCRASVDTSGRCPPRGGRRRGWGRPYR